MLNSNFKKIYSGYFLGNVCSSWATFNCTIWSRWLQVTLLVLAKVAHFSTFLGRLDGLPFQLPLTLFINNSASDVCPKWQSLLSFWKLFSAEITYSWLFMPTSSVTRFFQYLSIYKKNYNLHKRIISNEVGLKVGQINAYNCQKVLFFPNLVTLLRGRYIRTKRTFSTWNITKSWRKHIVVNLASLYLVYLRLFKNEWNRKFHHQIMLRLREAFSLRV